MLKRTVCYLALFIIYILLSTTRSFAADSRRPNILLITLDSLRPDHLSCYGYIRKTSPCIDELAEEGVLFTQAIAQSSTTFYSMPSIIFSRYPNFFKVKVDKFYEYERKKDVDSLVKIIKNSGYNIGLFLRSTSSLLPIYFTITGYADEVGLYLKPLVEGYDKEIYKEAEESTQMAARFISKNKDRPFFIWLLYHPPHAPYVTPANYQNLFIEDALYKKQKEEFGELVPDFDLTHSINGKIPVGSYLEPYKEAAYYFAQYDSYIRYVDDKIREIVEKLKILKLYENTLIIIHSDHGELMGEHNRYFCHGEVLYDPLLKAALIIKYKDFPKMKKIEAQIELIDIAPTILDISYITSPLTFEGQSLVDIILGRKDKHKEYAFSLLGDYKISLRTAKYKLIKNIRPTFLEKKYKLKVEKYELYDLQSDPNETQNVFKEKKDIFINLNKILKDFENKIFFDTVDLTKDTYQESSATEKLKSLGYLQ